VILDQAQQSYNAAAYSALTAGGVGVVWSSTTFTYTHQKTITVDDDGSGGRGLIAATGWTG
jgi:phosphatidylserine/phosphatidylglycerophosphate/cardiolipin synthase-like enzyme